MRCAWQEFIQLLPLWMRKDVDTLGKDELQELRLRVRLPPELVTISGSLWLRRNVSAEDLSFVMNATSQYSPWAASTLRNGYITAAGGHRIGVCGEAVIHDGLMSGIRNPFSVCMRVARDFPGIANAAQCYTGSVLIVGKPGSGKTTLLRDLIRQRSEDREGSVVVVDERGELFPLIHGTSCFPAGKRTDIMTNCTKTQGISTVLRTMGPACIAVDEITEQADCDALMRAGWSGVSLLATAHAGGRTDLLRRPAYQPIIESKLFDTLLVMQPDKSWRAERILL
ncbi:MAG: Flp pilus assembly complex ATPase component TadA [Oscillospiraceae bacterium]|nr:Flp pilus assembly complex ATPase component TadA [Oscillospiraceae bacterium]